MQMKVKEEQYNVGVIIGRFQVPSLHDAHKGLIQYVCDNHDKVVILLGLSPLRVTMENPLDFEARKQMILDSFPKVNVLYIKDVYYDATWSRKLDEIVEDVLTPSQTAILYGGRESFISHYVGRYPTRELEQDVYISGSEIRKSVSTRSVKATSDFRAGVVWASAARFPTVYPTVDVAVLNEVGERILLGRKSDEQKFRFFGGFADPKDDSFAQTARREVMEEAGIAITDPQFVTSIKIDDWRYRGEVDKIITTLFVAKFFSGSIRPGDDIAEVRWFELDGDLYDKMVPAHHGLLDALFFQQPAVV